MQDNIFSLLSVLLLHFESWKIYYNFLGLKGGIFYLILSGSLLFESLFLVAEKP